MSLAIVEEVVPRAPAPGILAPVVLGFASSRVEAASMPEEAAPDTWGPWSFTVHNEGDEGVFGGGITNAGGPGPLKVRWRDEETEVPVGRTYIIYYPESKPNCTRVETSGEIMFPGAGDYKVLVEGVHREDAYWVMDHYVEFAVSVTVPEEWAWWWPLALGGGALALVAVGGVVVAEERRKEEMMLMMMARRR